MLKPGIRFMELTEAESLNRISAISDISYSMVSEGLDSVICSLPLNAVITGCDSKNTFTSPDALVESKRQSFRSLTLRNDISLSSATRICELLPSAINIFIAFS